MLNSELWLAMLSIFGSGAVMAIACALISLGGDNFYRRIIGYGLQGAVIISLPSLLSRYFRLVEARSDWDSTISSLLGVMPIVVAFVLAIVCISWDSQIIERRKKEREEAQNG